jgi:DNA-binding CsgD family transcriptional regulator
MQPDPPTLAPREREVFIELANGYEFPEIAEHLGITRQNAWQYAMNACAKLGASTVVQGVLLAYKLGLIPGTDVSPVRAG